MEMVKIKHREFEIIKSISDNSFVARRKNKDYFVRKFIPKSQEGNELTYALEKISGAGIKSPKLYWIDKKLGYVVTDYVDGELMSDYLSNNDMTEELYKQLFDNAYLAKISRMTLNYEPDKWMLCNGELLYIYPMFIIYQREKDLVDRYLRLWFNTKELSKFLSELGKSYDKSRIKDEYLTNKNIVLMTCKYYR